MFFANVQNTTTCRICKNYFFLQEWPLPGLGFTCTYDKPMDTDDDHE